MTLDVGSLLVRHEALAPNGAEGFPSCAGAQRRLQRRVRSDSSAVFPQTHIICLQGERTGVGLLVTEVLDLE